MLERLGRLETRATVEFVWTRDPVGDVDAYVVSVRDLERLSSRLRPDGQATPVILAYGPGEHLRAAFLAGCADYLKEPWDPVELETRLERVLLARPDTTAWPFALEGKTLRLPDGRAVKLSAHEAVVAGLLLSNRGAIVSRRALAYALWGHPPSRTSRAVDMHVSALRRKLGRDIISCVRGQGYVISVASAASTDL